MRDHNHERGDDPPRFEWVTGRLVDRWQRMREIGGRPRRPPTGRGRFARGTFKVRL